MSGYTNFVQKKKTSFPRSMNRHFVRSTKKERSEGLTSQ